MRTGHAKGVKVKFSVLGYMTPEELEARYE